METPEPDSMKCYIWQYPTNSVKGSILANLEQRKVKGRICTIHRRVIYLV
jgi:hypothetical protein